MTLSIITVTGMVSGSPELTVDQLVDHAVVDGQGRLLVSMIDVLALIRPRADADLLLFEFTNGASRALRISEIVESDEVGIQLQGSPRPECAALWSAHTRSSASSTSSPLASMAALSFAVFVGSP